MPAKPPPVTLEHKRTIRIRPIILKARQGMLNRALTASLVLPNGRTTRSFSRTPSMELRCPSGSLGFVDYVDSPVTLNHSQRSPVANRSLLVLRFLPNKLFRSCCVRRLHRIEIQHLREMVLCFT